MPLSFLIQTLELLWNKRMSKHWYTCILEPTISFSLALSLDQCEVHHQRIEIAIKLCYKYIHGKIMLQIIFLIN